MDYQCYHTDYATTDSGTTVNNSEHYVLQEVIKYDRFFKRIK